MNHFYMYHCRIGHEERSSEDDDDDDEEEELDADDDDHSSAAAPSDEDEWTSNNAKVEHDRTLTLSTTFGSISSEMLDGYSLWAMKYRARHRSMSLDDKRLYRTWKKMSAHDRQRWCLKAEKENYHYPITAELLKTTASNTSITTATATTAMSSTTMNNTGVTIDAHTGSKSNKSTKRKKTNDEHPPILLQKTLNQYSKQQTSMSAIRPPNAFVKSTLVPVTATSTIATTSTTISPPKNYDVADIAAGIYLLGESLTKMGEKVRQLGHLNPRGTSAATSIDSLSAILFDGTLCACNLMACLGNEITSMNSTSTMRSDALTNKLMENVGILLPGLN
jgi:hypothetical protein